MPQIFDCSDEPLPELPDKELEWLIISGWYTPKNPERLQRTVEEHFQRGGLEGESQEDFLKRKPYLLTRGNEEFKYSQILYCYNKIDSWKETSVDFPYLKAHLYDKEGNILEENFLKFNPKEAGEDYRSFLVQIPYYKEGHRLKIIRELEGEQKEIFMDIPVDSKAYLIENNILVRSDTSGIGFQYDKDMRCHSGK